MRIIEHLIPTVKFQRSLKPFYFFRGCYSHRLPQLCHSVLLKASTQRQRQNGKNMKMEFNMMEWYGKEEEEDYIECHVLITPDIFD